MNIKTETKRKITVVLTCALLFLSACQAGTRNSTAIPTETALPTVNPEEVEIRAGIQKTLDDYNSGLEKNDKSLFMDNIDANNQTLWTTAYSTFDGLESSGWLQTIKLGMTVDQIKVLPQGLVLAKIIRDRDGWVTNWYFRKKDDKWVLTEPTLQEAGAPQTFENDGYTFKTYPIAEDLNAEYIALMEKARAHVQKDLGKVPDGNLQITIYPGAAMSPYSTGDVSGWYTSPNANGTDDIYTLAPATYFYGFYDPKIGWEPDIESLLAHELTHVAYVRSFGNPGQGVDWFFDGLAEYEGGLDEMPDVKDAVQNNTLYPILDESGKNVDLAHATTLENGPLAWGLEESLVTFIVDKYGGMDTFWALARSYDKTQDMKKAIRETLGISYEDFDSAWRTWLKEDYINRD